VGAVAGGRRAALLERRTWPSTDRLGADAAGLFSPTKVCADEALEDALYDSQALQRFACIELDAEGCARRHHAAQIPPPARDPRPGPSALFTAINADLAARGLLLREGTLVDATLIAAPSSTKNQKRARDPAMHQTKKGN
jgi:transposase, IS5 family